MPFKTLFKMLKNRLLFIALFAASTVYGYWFLKHGNTKKKYLLFE